MNNMNLVLYSTRNLAFEKLMISRSNFHWHSFLVKFQRDVQVCHVAS